MNSAVVGLLAIVAFAAAHPQSRSFATDWETKIQNLEAKFKSFVHDKASKNIEAVNHANAWFEQKLEDIVQFQKEKIEETVEQAMEAIEMFKEVDAKCYENATKDIAAAEEAAIVNLAGCQNLSTAYQDIDVIAQQAQVVAVDVLADVKVIVEGVGQCSPQTGIKKWECVFQYVTAEIKNLVNQWPEVKKFINTVKVEGSDAELQVETCLNDPSQVSLNKKVQEALQEFSACYKKSSL